MKPNGNPARLEKRIYVRLPTDLMNRCKDAANRNGLSLSSWARLVLSQAASKGLRIK